MLVQSMQMAAAAAAMATAMAIATARSGCYLQENMCGCVVGLPCCEHSSNNRCSNGICSHGSRSSTTYSGKWGMLLDL